MTSRLTITIGPESVARLEAIKARIDFATAILPSNASIVGRGLELLCRELGIADPVRVVTTDRANEETT